MTCDNSRLSPPKFAVDCTPNHSLTSPENDAALSGYLRASLADSTKRAYASDLLAFLAGGGSIPTTPEMVARHLADQASNRSPYTLARRLVSIGKAHTCHGLANPCDSELVRATLRGIRRTHGTSQRQVDPLLREDLLGILQHIPDTTKGIRDRALLLVGFAAALRRSELAAIEVADLRFVPEGIVLRLRSGKTDQEGAGRDIGLPYGRTRACPVKAVRAWLERSGISAGPVFRPITKGGAIQTTAISGQAVALIVKTYAEAAGLDSSRFAGHSLRAGLITSAAKVGVSSWKLRQQSGHQSEAMLARYVRDGELFLGNAAGAVL